MSEKPTIDRYTSENMIALQVFHDSGQSEFNGVDGRTLHAFARRELVWFESVDPWAKSKRYRGGLTPKGRAVLEILEDGDMDHGPLDDAKESR